MNLIRHIRFQLQHIFCEQQLLGKMTALNLLMAGAAGCRVKALGAALAAGPHRRAMRSSSPLADPPAWRCWRRCAGEGSRWAIFVVLTHRHQG